MARPEKPEEDRVWRLRKAPRDNPGVEKIKVYRDEFDQPTAKWEDAEVDTLFRKVKRREEEGRELGPEEPLPADLDADGFCR